VMVWRKATSDDEDDEGELSDVSVFGTN